MTEDQRKITEKIISRRLTEEWDREWKKAWHKAHEESSIPNTVTYIEPLISNLGDFDEGVQQAQEESNFKMMKLLHYKEQ